MIGIKEIESARFLFMSIKDLEEELSSFYGEKCLNMTGMPRSTAPHDSVSETVIKRDGYREKLCEMIARYKEQASEILEFILDIDDAVIRECIILRGIKGMSWNDISVKIDPDALSDGCTPEALRQRWARFWRGRKGVEVWRK